MRISILTVAAVSTMLGFAGLVSADDEEKVALDKVPAVVKKAAMDKFPGAELKKASKEVEDGKTTYELDLASKGMEYSLTIKDDGTIEEIEREIKLEEMPAAGLAALKAKYPDATFKDSVEVTKPASGTTGFEVVVERTGKPKVEAVLDASGKITGENKED